MFICTLSSCSFSFDVYTQLGEENNQPEVLPHFLLYARAKNL